MITNVSKTNTVRLVAMIAALAVVFAGVAVLVSDNGVDAATNDTQSYSGTLSGVQELNNNVIIDNKLTVTTNGVLIVSGNLTINAGVTVTVEKGGQIIVGNGSTTPLVTIDGNVVVTGSGKNTNNDEIGAANYNSNDVTNAIPSIFMIKGAAAEENLNTFKDSGVVISGAVSVQKGAHFTGSNGEALVKNSGTLTIDGEATEISGLDVYVAVGGEFTLAGQVGEDGMTVSSYGTSNVFTLATANIAPSEDLDTAGKTDDAVSELTFTTTNKNINGYTDDATSTAVLIKEFALNIEGTVANMDVLTLGSVQCVADNSNGTVTYKEDSDNTVYYTSEEAAEHAAGAGGTKAVAYNDVVIGKVIVSDLTIASTAALDVGTDSNNVYLVINGSLDVEETTKTDYTDAGAKTDSVTGITSNDDLVSLVTIGKGSIVEVVGTVTANYDSINAVEQANLGLFVINGGSATFNDFSDKIVSSFYGAYYVDKDKTAHVSDLATAISGAVAAGIDDVSVYAVANSEADGGYGGYMISSDLAIPDDITLNIYNALVVDEGVTVTISADAKIDMPESWAGIFVNGTIVDSSEELADLETQMTFQVKIVNEDAETNTYTTLANALANTTSGIIYLYNDVVISGTVTIPENVTVQFDASASGKKITFENSNATLVINGTLYLDATTRLVPGYGTVTVNNILATPSTSSMTTSTWGIYGVYYAADLVGDDDADELVITSAAVAGANSANVTGTMTVYGKVSMGTVTFTQGEDQMLTVAINNTYNGSTDKNVATGNITLVGAKFDTTAGAFTGTVTTDVTSGTTTLSFDKSKGVIVGFNSVENIDDTTTTSVSLTATATVIGSVALTAGEASIDSDMIFSSSTADYETGKLSVDIGATLNINKIVKLGSPNTTITIGSYTGSLSDFIAENSTFDVAGTVNVNNGGDLKWGYSVITGTVNVVKGGTLGLTLVQNDGNIAIADEVTGASVEVMVLSGTLNGNIAIGTLGGGYGDFGAIVALPGSDLSNGKIEWDSVNNETSAAVSELYINGTLYATIYANGNLPIQYIAQTADVIGVEKTGAKYYTDAALDNEVTSTSLATTYVGAYPAYYVVMEAQDATGVISAGTGLDLYIDNMKWTGGNTLTVGEHTVSFDVKAGYVGTEAYIEFNGQKVTDGKITVTADMVKDGFTLVASGATPVDYSQVGTSDDGGIGIVEILLVILVVVVVILAIIVVLRMMRS